MRIGRLFGGAWALSLALSAAAVAPPESAEITLHADQTDPQINRQVRATAD